MWVDKYTLICDWFVHDVIMWRGAVMIRALDSWSGGRGFDSGPLVRALDSWYRLKRSWIWLLTIPLLCNNARQVVHTHVYMCYAVKHYNLVAVMLYFWEGNHRPDWRLWQPTTWIMTKPSVWRLGSAADPMYCLWDYVYSYLSAMHCILQDDNNMLMCIVAIECMGTACYVLADEDFILSLLTNSSLRDKYQKYTFSDHVKVYLLGYFNFYHASAHWRTILI